MGPPAGRPGAERRRNAAHWSRRRRCGAPGAPSRCTRWLTWRRSGGCSTCWMPRLIPAPLARQARQQTQSSSRESRSSGPRPWQGRSPGSSRDSMGSSAALLSEPPPLLRPHKWRRGVMRMQRRSREKRSCRSSATTRMLGSGAPASELLNPSCLISPVCCRTCLPFWCARGTVSRPWGRQEPAFFSSSAACCLALISKSAKRSPEPCRAGAASTNEPGTPCPFPLQAPEEGQPAAVDQLPGAPAVEGAAAGRCRRCGRHPAAP